MISANDGLQERLSDLIRRVVGAEGRIPTPFPVDEQLSDLGLGSLTMVNLMLGIEAEFDLAIPPREITGENFHSLGTLTLLMRRLSTAR